MDPLSIVAGILAVLSASGKTAQGIEKLWGLHHREKHFRDLTSTVEGLRIQYQSVRPALECFRTTQNHVPGLRECLHDIEALCEETKKTFAALDKLIADIRPNGSHKLGKAQWIRRRDDLFRLKRQAKDNTRSLTASLNIFSNVQSWITISMVHSRLELSAHVSPQGCDRSLRIEPCDRHLAIDAPTRRSSIESFHSIDSDQEAEIHSRPPIPIQDLLPSTSTKIFCQGRCQCKCHSNFHATTPGWTRHIMGTLTLNRGGSPLLGCGPCGKGNCCKLGTVYMQINYVAPSWTFLKALVLCMQSEIVRGSIRTYNISAPRVIEYTAKIWSLIELGCVSELRDLFSEGKASPDDVLPDGTSLLKYAVLHQRNEVYSLLLAMGANPLFCDQSGVIAIQPGVDQALSGIYLGRPTHHDKEMPLDSFTTEEVLAQQDFSEIHLVVLGRRSQDLETLLMNNHTQTNLQDANGRTPLLWAAWKGDIASVVLLLKYGADVNKTDHELYTPLAKAAQAGHLSTVEILLTAKADMHIATSWGHQPIHLASENRPNGHRVVEELLEWGADPNAYSKGSGTPLHNAANRGSIHTIKALVAHGADIDAIGENRSTAAMVALYCWNEAAFIHLAKAGARLDLVNNSGHNIVQLATWTASIRAWDLLVERADGGTLRKINANALHEGHNIEQCYHQCRKLWYVGKRGDADLERALFIRMIKTCGFQETG